MSGHSKWNTIKRKKGLVDAKRGKIFTKVIREITMATREGGGDPDGNPRLRTAISAARAQNMPNSNVERAIKKGTGELEGVSYEEITYEGYGPAGAAVIVDVMTDNKQRILAEVRHLFSKYNGNLGENGCVAWNFETKGLIVVPQEAITEEKLMELVLEAGADDIRDEGKNFEIITDPKDLEAVKEKLDQAKIPMLVSEIAKLPKNTVRLEGKHAEQMIKLVDSLEDNDDVQHVYNNSDVSEEVMERFSGG